MSCPFAKIAGGAGTSDAALKVFGGINEQHAAGPATGNLIAMKPVGGEVVVEAPVQTGGTGLMEVAVPAVLVTAAEIVRRRKGGRKDSRKEKKDVEMGGEVTLPAVPVEVAQFGEKAVLPAALVVASQVAESKGGEKEDELMGGRKERKERKESRKERKESRKERKESRKERKESRKERKERKESRKTRKERK